MIVPTERRASVRHTPVDKETKVVLMDLLGGQITRARLVNISQDGALILTDQQPGLNRPLHVRIDSAADLGWITAIPVRFGETREVGLRFTRPCPPEFLFEATRGGHDRLASPSEEETQRVEGPPEYPA
jgi:hypothetical protein